MKQDTAKKLAGIDISHNAVQISIYDVAMHEMEDIYLPLQDAKTKMIEKGYAVLSDYMRENNIQWKQFESVVFSLEDASNKNRKYLKDMLGSAFIRKYHVTIITRFRAFAEYIFRQDRVKWDNNTVLFDFNDGALNCVLVDRIQAAKQRAYRVYMQEISLADFGMRGMETAEEKDRKFADMLKFFFGQHKAQAIFLNGNGFEGTWMRKTKNLLCANGREVLRGSSVYANGAALMNSSSVDLFEDGMVLMNAPDMVQHTIGIMTRGSKTEHIPITTIGREWYNTSGSIDVILDKSQKVDIFYYNAKENMMQSAVYQLNDLPRRPIHTTRVRVSVSFSSALEGSIMLQDLGFGMMYPATGKVQTFPFSLIS